MLRSADEELRLLGARIEDMIARAGRGLTAISPFLTPREARFAARLLSDRLAAGTAVLWGGYTGAERARLVLLPDYAEGLVDPTALALDPLSALANAGLEDVSEMLREAVCLLSIQGSGFRALSHRDYLGAVLGLGLDRDAVGDIVVDMPDVPSGDQMPTPRAYLVTDARIAAFLCTDLDKVATDTVRVRCLGADTSVIPSRRLSPIRDTIASERLDCVVAALCNLSREKAQTAIRQGLCELDYESVLACDHTVIPPATVSVRGYGKFSVDKFDGETKKGRIRLVAGKYI